MHNLKDKNVTLISVGSTGDILPYISLAIKLKEKGARVTLCSYVNYTELVQNNKINFYPLSFDIKDFLKSEDIGKRFTKNFFKEMAALKKTLEPVFYRNFDETWEASKNADILIYHPLVYNGLNLAEKLDIPAFLSAAVPVLAPTKDFTVPTFGYKDLGLLNKLSYLTLRLSLMPYHSIINNWSVKKLGLKPYTPFKSPFKRNGKDIPILYSYSPALFPAASDWKEHVNISGYWFLNQQHYWKPSEELTQFINSGPPPIYIGFGSMPGTNTDKLTEIIIDTINLSKQRAIVATGWGGLNKIENTKNILCIESAPHDWLFPRVSLIIHHGGSGTTAATLKFAKPSIICPFMLDQFFWSKLLYKKGLSLKPLPQITLNSGQLVSFINETLKDNKIKENISNLSSTINNEDGPEEAARFISSYL